MVHLEGRQLEVFTEAVRQLREEYPDLLRDFDFRVIDPKSSRRGDTTGFCVDAFIDPTITPKRKNLILIGNSQTDYSEALSVVSHNRKPLLGSFGLVRMLSDSDQEALKSDPSYISDSSNEQSPLALKDAMLLLPPIRGENDETEEPELILDISDQLAQASLVNVFPAKEGEDEVVKQKEILLKLFKSPQLGHSFLQKELSQELIKKIASDGCFGTKEENSLPETARTLLDLILWREDLSSSNLPLAKLCNQDMIKKLVKHLDQLSSDNPELSAEINSFKEPLTKGMDEFTQELKGFNIETLPSSSLPLKLPEVTMKLRAEQKPAQEAYDLDALVNRLSLLQGLKLSSFVLAEAAPFTQEFKGYFCGHSDELKQEETYQAASYLRGVSMELTCDQRSALALRILLALKNSKDYIWEGDESQRKIPTDERLRVAAQALYKLGVVGQTKLN